jgi:hypothetical protein
MIEVIVVFIAAGALAVWALAPLFGPPSGDASPANERLNSLIESKQAVYRSILDLEFDHQIGKVSDPDYVALRRQHEAEAMAILKEMDKEASLENSADLLEAEITAARDRLRRR